MDAAQADAEDRRYADIKSEQAMRMFTVARDRYNTTFKSNQPRIRYAAVYDALSIAQMINPSWMTDSQRAEFLAWHRMASEELQQLARQLDDGRNAKDATVSSTVPVDIAEADRIIQLARKSALSVDLTVIDNATPDGKLEGCLVDCEKARGLLSKSVPEDSDAQWAKAMDLLAATVSALKKRQQMRYTLWAEKVYRDATAKDAAGPNEAMSFYRKLSEVNLSLVLEPSLAREITRRLYELYDSMKAQEEKTKVRYDAIRAIDKRKSLADF
jgi:hypothetical protein